MLNESKNSREVFTQKKPLLACSADARIGCCNPPKLPALAQSRGVGWKHSLWEPGQDILISFLEGTENKHKHVKEQASKWEEFINLNLVWDVPREESDVRIAFDNEGGGWAYVGKDNLLIPKNLPTMNLGYFETDEEGNDRLVLHEMGHMFGYLHGQENPEANIPWKGGEPPSGYYSPDGLASDYAEVVHTQFDPLSIMVYFVTNDMTDGDYTIPVNYKISELDKQWAIINYGVKEAEVIIEDPTDADMPPDLNNKVFLPNI